MQDLRKDSIVSRFAWIPLGIVFFIFYIATAQKNPIADGYSLIERLQSGNIRYSHLLYLPAAAALRWILSPAVTLGAQQTLTLLSALSGAGGVALGYLIARRLLKNFTLAATCSILLGILPGYWFHATAVEKYSFHAFCMMASTWVILPAVEGREITKLQMLLMTLGAALAPASHLSGAAVILQGFLLAWIAYRSNGLANRWRAPLAVFGGFILFFIAYQLNKGSGEAVAGYEHSILRDYYGQILTEWRSIPRWILGSFNQFFLYSSPISVFVAAGVFSAAKEEKPFVWMFLALAAGYVGLTLLLETRLWGCYFIPIFIFQTLIGLPVFFRIATSIPRAIGACALGALPISLDEYETHPLLAAFSFSAASVLVCIIIARVKYGGGAVSPISRILCVAALIATALVIDQRTTAPVVLRDANWSTVSSEWKAKTNQFITSTAKDSAVLVLESNIDKAAYWLDVLSNERPENYLCIIRYNLEAESEIPVLVAGVNRLIDQRLAAGKTVWAVGDPAAFGANSAPRAIAESVKLNYNCVAAPFELDSAFQLLKK